MPKSAEQTRQRSCKYLLIGSTEAYSGKSATILGIAQQLLAKGLDITYGKPLGTCFSEPRQDSIDEDVRFLAQTLNLPENRIGPTLLFLDKETLHRRMQGKDRTDYRQALVEALQFTGGDLVLLEGAATLDEGRLFNISLPEVAQLVDASVLLVVRYKSVLGVGALLSAKERLGDRSIGVVLNDIPEDQMEATATIVRPFLEQQGIPVLGLVPRSALLRSVSVGELAVRLDAEVLCRRDKLDLMVESLKIGAMNVNAAVRYFSSGRNMAIVTGGDRTDIQLAALETSTQCLILTGQIAPNPMILSRAEELEVPVLAVELDTLKTVEIINDSLGHIRLHEPIKVDYLRQLMAEHFAVDRLLAALGLEPAVTAR